MVNEDFSNSYFIDNYTTINKVEKSISEKLVKELSEDMVSVVPVACMCMHPFGAVPKGILIFEL